ncbi:MAG: glycosyltransferase family 4 protein [Candidatus Bathyarchaeota archaeon]|nr:glycosyltransferase family 4 protein [Candidatus Bathyarchaeota archaeon]
MKVTQVCQGFDRANLMLQPWRRVFEISRRIAAGGASVTIITNGESGQAEEQIENIRVIRMNNLMLAPFLNSKKLLSKIWGTDPDLVVWYGSPFSALYLSKLKSLGKPLIWDIDTDIYSLKFLFRIPHREILHPDSNLLQYLVTAAFSKRILRVVADSSLVSGLIVPNMHLRNTLCERGVSPTKIAVVPSTIETKDTCVTNLTNGKELRGKLGLKADDFVFSYFGAPNILRGPDVAILSLQRILKQRRKVKLLIFSRRKIGNASPEEQFNREEEEYLRGLARKIKVDDHVEIIPGFLDRKLLQEYLLASDAIVLPFRLVPSEPPLSVFEAMSLGKPVVTSNLGGLREIIGEDRGILVGSGNSNELAEAILLLAQNPEKVAALGKNAQQYAKSLPDWNCVAAQFARVLDNACQTG